MAYLAIYRKYRPNTFEKLIGQQHIVRTLTNQIKFDRVSHAYLFTGTRGTGKTSAARIFARAINCLNPQNGSPCNECKVCKELLNPNNMDIVEIDGASNNRVDEIRELREKVNYLPSVGKYKVYIIDEVHMLTDSAYNALLKTLEEPPSHVVFILCTTEVQKMPATILSRCLRFDFKLVGVDDLNKLMKEILTDSKIKFSDEAVNAIAVAGEGSVRDSLSVLDRCVAFAESKIEYNDVLEILGATDKTKIFELTNSIFNENVADILKEVDQISKSGKSISVLAKDIAVHIRDLLICKTCKEPQKILNFPQDLFLKMMEQAEQYDGQKLLAALDNFNKVEAELKTAINPRVSFEVVCLKTSGSGSSDKTDVLERRLNAIEKNGMAIQTEAQKKTEPTELKDFARGQLIWAQVLKGVRNADSMVLSAACAEIDSMYVLYDEFVLELNSTQMALLSQPVNLKKVDELIYGECGLKVKLFKKPDKLNSIDEDIKAMEHLIGKDKLKII